MDIIATQKYIRTAPRKLRVVADAAKKLSPSEAIEMLPFSGRRAAEPLVKVIRTAIANAENQGLSPDSLTFKEIQIGDGPRLKRGRPVSRGMWHPVLKRMSHIRVVLETKSQNSKSQKTNTKRQATKADTKENKKQESKKQKEGADKK